MEILGTVKPMLEALCGQSQQWQYWWWE